MSSPQAELHSVSSLERLAQELQAAPATIDSCLRETEDTLLPRLRRLERGVEQARDELRRAQRAAEAVRQSGAHDQSEDGSAVESAAEELEEARSNLARIENAVRDVRDALRRYKAAAADLSASKSGALTQGAAYVSERVKAARAYLAIQVSGGGVGTAAAAQHVPSFDNGTGKFIATKLAEAIVLAAEVGGLVTGVASDVGQGLDIPPLLNPDQEQAREVADRAGDVDTTLRATDHSRKRRAETAARIFASPQAEFDANSGSDKDKRE